MTKISSAGLKDEIRQIRTEYGKLKDDQAFVLWFLRAFIVDEESAAVSSLTGAPGDKMLDAIYVDHPARQVHFIQGKFHHDLNKRTESRAEILEFAERSALPLMREPERISFYNGLDPALRPKLDDALRYITRRHYALSLHFVTTHKVTANIVKEAARKVNSKRVDFMFECVDGTRVAIGFENYLDGVAPAPPMLRLKFDAKSTAMHYRFEASSGIESRVFTMGNERRWTTACRFRQENFRPERPWLSRREARCECCDALYTEKGAA